jgi:DNA-binding transcriptional ArsR family regulator
VSGAKKSASTKALMKRLRDACVAADLGRGPLTVLWSILSFANEAGEAWCSEGDIAERGLMEPRTVATHLAALVRAGLVWKIERKRGKLLVTLTYQPPHTIPNDGRALLFLPTAATSTGLEVWSGDPRVIGRPPQERTVERRAPAPSAPLAPPARTVPSAPTAPPARTSTRRAPDDAVPLGDLVSTVLPFIETTSPNDRDESVTNPEQAALRALYPELSFKAAREQAYDDQYLYLANLYPTSFAWRSSDRFERCDAWCQAADREDAERAARGEPKLEFIERAKRGLALRKAGAQLPNYVKTRSA